MSAVDFERWRQNFADIIENLVGRRIDYSRLYPAEVVKQNADGTLQLLADSPKIRGTGHNNVRIRHGLPGVSVEVAQGARVRIGFENGSPSDPFASLWDTDAAFITINLGLASNTEFVALANLVKDELDAMRTQHNAHLHATAALGPPVIPTVPMLPIGDVAATKVKAE